MKTAAGSFKVAPDAAGGGISRKITNATEKIAIAQAIEFLQKLLAGGVGGG